jgi:ABC-type uncharacterized transport system YnjBCD substrate-binding protein
MFKKASMVVLVATCAGNAGSAATPFGADTFNFKSSIDAASLTPETFDAVVTPAAKAELAHEVVFYDFADTLCDLMAKEVATFTTQTGIAVKHVCVDGDAAVQQFIAAQQAGSAAPADVFFGPNGAMRTLGTAGVIANLPLVAVLPNAQNLDPAAASASRGWANGGTVLPFHRNQTTLAYDSAVVASLPDTLEGVFDLAKTQGFKIAVTNPTDGGSGSGFLESALLALAPECKDDLYNFALTPDEAKAVADKCLPKVVEFFKAHAEQITYTNGNEASIQAIANGVAPIATVWEDDLYSLAAKGLVQKTVKSALLSSGEVGDGDGVFIASTTPAFEASLLLANFLMSDEVQIAKMELTGSRTARQDLSFEGKIPADLGAYLVPDAMYQANTRPRINGLVTDAAADAFVKQVIAQ